jgi:Restriction endonuclease/NACHT domain/Pentapeptide repeats (8 copies)
MSMTNPDDSKASPNWRVLERLVATNYEALGYKVTPNININGHQIDLVGTKHVAGVGLLNIAIEVKWRSQGSVGIDDVTKFKNVASDLRSSARITTAIMVTNCGYSQDAQACAHGHEWFKLLRIADLEQDLFNFSESLLKVKTEYEGSSIFHEYVALDTTVRQKKEDVVAVLEAEVASAQPITILVGDFGVGKSTVLERLFYNAVCRRLVDATAGYPVLLRLRSFLQYPDLWSFVSDGLRDNQYIMPTRKQFYTRLAIRQLVIILDGFDEIRTGASAADRAFYIKKLSPLIYGGSPCILATRPTYFQSFDEMAAIIASEASRRTTFSRINHRKLQVDKILARLKLTPGQVPTKESLQNVVQVAPLSDSSILEYISKYSIELRDVTGSSPEEIRDFLFKIYDIRDLMKRPLLLRMIIVTMIEGHINPKDDVDHVGPSMLYDFYTQVCAERDVGIRADGLSARDRLRACRAIAMRMFAKGSIELTGQEVAEIVCALFSDRLWQVDRDRTDQVLEGMLTDVRVCSFLSFSDDGSLRFSHKSYFDFFVAQNIVVERDQHYGALSKFVGLPLTQDMIYFLASFARQHENFGRLLLNGLNSQISTLCRKILFSAGDMLNGAEVVGGSLADAILADVRLEGVIVSDCDLSNVMLRNVVCHGWRLSNCNLRNCRLSSVSFTDSAIELDLTGVEIDQVKIAGSLMDLAGPRWTLREARIEVVECALGGRASLLDVLIEGSKILHLRRDLRLQQGSTLEVVGARMTCGADVCWYSAKSRIVLRMCELIGVWIEPFDIMMLSAPDREATDPRVELQGVRGIVFSSLDRIQWNANKAVEFKRRYGDVDIIDRGEVRRALRRIRGGYERIVEDGTGASEGERKAMDTKLIAHVSSIVEAHGLVAEMRGLYAE